MLARELPPAQQLARSWRMLAKKRVLAGMTTTIPLEEGVKADSADEQHIVRLEADDAHAHVKEDAEADEYRSVISRRHADLRAGPLPNIFQGREFITAKNTRTPHQLHFQRI